MHVCDGAVRVCVMCARCASVHAACVLCNVAGKKREKEEKREREREKQERERTRERRERERTRK